MNEELIAEAAGNLASWHDASVRALDVETSRDGLLWQADTPAPDVYFSAITLTGAAEADDHYQRVEALVEARGAGATLTVCDSWATLDLAPLGFHVLRRGTWMVRQPAPPRRSTFPADFAIERVITEKQLAAWEAASAEGFGSTPPETGTLHAPGILQDQRMQIFSGSAEGRVVAGAMAYIGDRILGVYGVSTVPGYRRRRYAEMLTWRCVLARPNVPAVLQPSEPAEPLYRQMGFELAGEYIAWIRPAG